MTKLARINNIKFGAPLSLSLSLSSSFSLFYDDRHLQEVQVYSSVQGTYLPVVPLYLLPVGTVLTSFLPILTFFVTSAGGCKKKVDRREIGLIYSFTHSFMHSSFEVHVEDFTN